MAGGSGIEVMGSEHYENISDGDEDGSGGQAEGAGGANGDGSRDGAPDGGVRGGGDGGPGEGLGFELGPPRYGFNDRVRPLVGVSPCCSLASGLVPQRGRESLLASWWVVSRGARRTRGYRPENDGGSDHGALVGRRLCHAYTTKVEPVDTCMSHELGSIESDTYPSRKASDEAVYTYSPPHTNI